MRLPSRTWPSLGLSCLLASTLSPVGAIDFNPDDPASIRKAAKTAAEGMLSVYTGNQPGGTPGLLPLPPAPPGYYWWEAGGMMGSLIEYWSLTGDDSYNDLVKQALLFQVGPDNNYEPANQSSSEGNDDQVFWAFAVLDAAEYKFPNPTPQEPQWLALAQAVFNRQAGRWDAAHCGGGLRWQFYNFLNGYDYKNTISNAGFFQLGARLARYTGNDSYASTASKTWDWLTESKIVAGDDETGYTVYDGADIADDCANPHQAYFTYNYGTLIMGCAYLYDYYGKDPKWLGHLQGVLKGAQKFFPSTNGGIMTETQCETFPLGSPAACNTDQQSFKTYLSRWMTMAALLVPPVQDQILAQLKTSAEGAAKACTGPAMGSGVACGLKWYAGKFDGFQGVGENLAAMSIFANQMVNHVGPLAGGKNDNGFGTPIMPLTAKTGGNSTGDPSAGSEPTVQLPASVTRPITTADRAGAGILTALVIGASAYMSWFVISSKGDNPVIF